MFLAVALAACAIAAPTTVNLPAKPVRVQTITLLPPESLESMWDRATLILRVRVAATKPRAIGSDPVHVFTEATSDVIDVYKGDARAHSSIKFLQSAGEVEMPTEVIRIEGATPLQSQREYVVFLTANRPFDAFLLTYDIDSAFEIREGRVLPLGHSAVSEERRDMPAQRFAAELERLRDRRAVRK
jgi:hypothetical protein